ATTGPTTTAPMAVMGQSGVRGIGSVSAIVGTVTEPFGSGVSAERSNNILVDVKPMDEVKVYAAYVKFWNTGLANANEGAVKLGKGEELETSKVTTIVTEPTSIVTTTEGAKGPSAGQEP